MDQRDGKLVIGVFQCMQGLIRVIVMHIVGADNPDSVFTLINKTGCINQHGYPDLFHGIEHVTSIVIAQNANESMLAVDVFDQIFKTPNDMLVAPM
ncbi:MAG: hypothetical protein NTU74_02645 [Deltaproteobacteria bacterium]|nr:hypothetical protein [Deltaproteobacteria bacterium]